MTIAAASYLTLFAPLVGCLLIAVLGMVLPQRYAGWLGSLAVLAGFVGALAALLQWNGANHDHGILLSPYTWLQAGAFNIDFSLLIDPLSIFEMLIVTGVGFLIHVYSIGYMRGDPQERRFFAYMNLFIFAMLLLVMAGNFVFLLIGWGLVGMASYLLIGFWHDRPTAVAAAKKAFIVNAIGDISLMLGLFLIFARTGALSYPDVFERLPAVVPEGSGTAAVIGLLLLGGALAKSAQLPLHTWLPDAMEGPTPVSALIHAATMVTAGVYLVARMWPVFDLSEPVQITIALVGALTLVVAGFLALVQVDIKRVIAYSTMSQIGYMFVAVGVGAYSAGMFHLMTHAFFKALLFLAAGIIIHALNDEQDIRQMGGLKKYMPRTYWLFLAASLALAGIFPLAGFFSKDEVLAFALTSADSGAFGPIGYVIYAFGLAGVFLTGIYSFRLFYTVFHGEEGDATRALAAAAATATPAASSAPTPAAAEAHAEAHAHAHGEAPATMMAPVALLGVLSIVGGLLVIPGAWDVVGSFLHHAEAAPLRASLEHAEFSATTAWLLALLVSLPVALGGIFVATRIWHDGRWAHLRTRFSSGEPALQSGLGFDAFYDRIFLRPAIGVARFTGNLVERRIVAPSIDLAIDSARMAGSVVGALQSGLVRLYALGTALAVVAILVTFLWAER